MFRKGLERLIGEAGESEEMVKGDKKRNFYRRDDEEGRKQGALDEGVGF